MLCAFSIGGSFDFLVFLCYTSKHRFGVVAREEALSAAISLSCRSKSRSVNVFFEFSKTASLLELSKLRIHRCPNHAVP